MRFVTRTCCQCSSQFEKTVSSANRAEKYRAKIYCSKACVGIARRVEKSQEQKKAEKAEYDRAYRQRNACALKTKKAAYYQMTKDPEKERLKRKEMMHRHIAYCQRPEYKKWKSAYDKRYKAKKYFGDFADAYLLLQGIEEEIDKRASRYEIYLENGVINKALTRRRSL